MHNFGESRTHASIMKNTEILQRNHAYRESQQPTVIALVELVSLDQILCHLHQGALYADPSERFTHFTGFLLYQLEQ